ncbi:MAG: CoA-binding protein [Myxococcales bacterium]|nr:MAG: CoA-binding protein [Myxococcales bacterium]
MDTFFYPDSIAVVGVSSSPSNLAQRILANLRRFRYAGKVWAIGPRDEEVEGYPLFRSVADVPEKIDLAVLLVPAKNVPQVAEECGRKGIRRLIIESGGFREFSGGESDVERRLLEVCRRYGIRFLGPNCIGIINQENGLCTPFTRPIAPFVEGGISVISQSGGVGLSHVMDLTSEYIGLNKFISFGNGLDIDEVDLIEYLGGDGGTSMISAYLEGISRGRDFLRVVSRQKKPVVVLKSNTQPSTQRVATSHSAAISGDEDVLDDAFRQVGVLRVPDSLVWANVSKQLTLPLMKGNRLAILSRSGGYAVMAADAASQMGFELPPFPDGFFDACRQYFEKSVITLQNPLDLGQIIFHPVVVHILEETLKLDEFDGVLLIYNYDAQGAPDEAHQFISQIMPLMYRYQKPVTTVLITQRHERQYIRESYALPLFRTAFHGVQALAYSRDAVRAAERRRPFETEAEPAAALPQAAELVASWRKAGRAPTVADALELLQLYGVPMVRRAVACSRDEALEKVEGLKFPIALKLIHADAPHKSDVGGVQLNLKDDYGLITGWDEIAKAASRARLAGGMECALIQEMAPQGWEMFVGVKYDPSFGPVVLAGSGGLLAEVVRDVAARVAPLTREDAAELLSETRASQLLQGFRGLGPADTEAFVELIVAVARLIIAHPEIQALDLNPVIVHPKGKGLTVVDARLVLKPA